MMYLIRRGPDFRKDIQDMHVLRRRVFAERLEWAVNIEGDLEIDQFDDYDPIYLVHRGSNGQVDGCIRLLPTQGPNMLRDVFPQLAEQPIPSSPTIWESSRFCLDTSSCTDQSASGLAAGTYELFLGLIEFGLYMGLSHIATVTDVRVERILSRANWPLERLGKPQRIGNTLAVAGLVETSERTLQNMREKVGVTQPLLWLPAHTAARAA